MKKVEISKIKIVICAMNSFLSMHHLTGSSTVPFSSFCVAYLGKKKNVFEKFYLRTFSELLDDMKPIFEPIDFEFGICIVYTCMKHILYVFFKISMFENLIKYFFRFDF